MLRWLGCTVVVFWLACGSAATETSGTDDVSQGETGGEAAGGTGGETQGGTGGETQGGTGAEVAGSGGEGAGSGGETTGDSGSGGAAAPSGECPATLEEAVRSSGCVIGMQECTYERGDCQCVGPPQCGGAMMRPPEPGSQGTLSCTSQDPSVTRADGCPLAMPAANGRCGEARVCDYTICSWNQQLARCQRGRWHLERHMGPPPP